MKKWELLSELGIRNQESGIDDVIKILLKNRGITTKKEKEEFLHPKLEDVTVDSVGIKKTQLKKALLRIKKAIEKEEHIVVFGDYDVDGICGAAILWETLYALGAKAMPYVPHRIDEGYGLSTKGISNVILNLFQDPKRTQNEIPKQVRNDKIGLIITVDNGIVANEAVAFANKQGIDVIITDHHVPSKKLPKAHAIVHTTKLCGTGVAYLLSKELKTTENDHLALVALATVADLVPLTGANRTLTKFGLEELRKTKRPGLLALFQEAILDKKTIDTYQIGHVIAPRLNAMGRLEFAMDSLRLLCTTNPKRAKALALLLGSTNRERQLLTQETVAHALENLKSQKSNLKNLLFIAHETYQPGVIGLVAGRLVEEFYRPSIVIAIGETHSKASARSIAGFNIIEFIRTHADLLVDAGGHPMAAGFTVETNKLVLLQEKLEQAAIEQITEDLLTRTLKIDMELPLAKVNQELYDELQTLAPFGMLNPEPVFLTKGVVVEDIRLVGKDRRHLKLNLKSQVSNLNFDAIAFGLGALAAEVHVGDRIDIAYIIDENVWQGRKSLQLKIRDIKKN